MDTVNIAECLPTDTITELWGPVFSSLAILKSSLLQFRTPPAVTLTKDTFKPYFVEEEEPTRTLRQSDKIGAGSAAEDDLLNISNSQSLECNNRRGDYEHAIAEEKRKVEQLAYEIERLTTIIEGQKVHVDQKNLLHLAEKEISRLEELNKEAANVLFVLRNDLVIERESNQALLQNNQTLLNALERSSLDAEETLTDAEVQCNLDVNEFCQKLDERAEKTRFELQTKFDRHEQEFARKLAEKDDEIKRMRSVDNRNGELSKVVAKLRRDLVQREKLLSNKKEIPSFTELLINSSRRGTPRMHDNNVYRSSSLNSHLNTLTEPDNALETACIPISSSRHSSISDMSNPSNFKYKDLTPTRQAELERRNRAQQPHLKSSYPVETTDRAWRHSPHAQQTDNFTESTESMGKLIKKAGLLKKLQSSLHKPKKSKGVLDNKENLPELVVKIPKVTEKPVAFVVDITPPGAAKKSRKTSKK